MHHGNDDMYSVQRCIDTQRGDRERQTDLSYEDLVWTNQAMLYAEVASYIEAKAVAAGWEVERYYDFHPEWTDWMIREGDSPIED